MIYQMGNLEKLKEIIEKIKLKVFSIETQYKFLKISKIVLNELSIYEEQQALIIKTYAEYDEKNTIVFSDDGGVKIKDGYVEECLLKLNELNEMQITFPDLYFSLQELENLSLTLEDLIYLEPFIKK